jgi:putative transposase
MTHPDRRSIRLQGYDYSLAGAYFVTIVTQKRLPLFGQVQEGIALLTPPGEMVKQWWYQIENKFSRVHLDEFVIMPNHTHAIILLTPDLPEGSIRNNPPVGAHLCVRPLDVIDPKNQGGHTGPPLPEIIQWFKTMTTNAYIRGVKQFGWPSFPGQLWQRNYYDHIIRNESDLDNVREYILNNPMSWEQDQENPQIP